MTSRQERYRNIEAGVEAGNALSRDEAKWLWINATDDEMCDLAGRVRSRFHQKDVASVFADENYQLHQCLRGQM